MKPEDELILHKYYVTRNDENNRVIKIEMTPAEYHQAKTSGYINGIGNCYIAESYDEALKGCEHAALSRKEC